MLAPAPPPLPCMLLHPNPSACGPGLLRPPPCRAKLHLATLLRLRCAAPGWAVAQVLQAVLSAQLVEGPGTFREELDLPDHVVVEAVADWQTMVGLAC